ncbi:malic enzyme [Sulfitobacter porphyrae]|uniref:Malic enzyme n=1 Tax=Sulfitobacter porphyrae TaxID=1246864 RepID=A0ABW2B0A1_9RHOB
MTRFTTMGDKIANKKKKSLKAAKPAPKAAATVADIKPAAPRK